MSSHDHGKAFALLSLVAINGILALTIVARLQTSPADVMHEVKMTRSQLISELARVQSIALENEKAILEGTIWMNSLTATLEGAAGERFRWADGEKAFNELIEANKLKRPEDFHLDSSRLSGIDWPKVREPKYPDNNPPELKEK